MNPDINEDDFLKAVTMAHIAASLLEDHFGDKASQKALTGKPNTYFVGEEDLNAMLFAVYEVQNAIKDLRDKVSAAVKPCA